MSRARTACLPLSNSACFSLCCVFSIKLLIWQRIKRDICRLESVTEFSLLRFVGRRQRSATGRYFCPGLPSQTGSGTLAEVVVIYVCLPRVCCPQHELCLQRKWPSSELWRHALHCLERHSSASLDSAVHTRTTGKYAAITPITSMSMNKIEPLM